MEKGEMRVEANISVTTDPKVFGTKVEVKNLNSVRSAERAIKYEAARMIELIETGEGIKITQETRGWDEAKQSTFSQRSKEEAQDYRYFPDPDLPKMKLYEIFDLESLKKELPELPDAKRERYRADFGIKDEDIETYINDMALGIWFEDIAKLLKSREKIKVASNYITSDFIGLKKNHPNTVMILPERIAELMAMATDGTLSSRATKNILAIICLPNEQGMMDNRSPMQIAESEGLLQKNDEGALKAITEKVIADNQKVVETYKAGKENALMSLVGIIMKETKGSANPQLVQKILKELL
jgi:aspartyl-tRNA(Asn)/glutamyl-tRNA(Gln) amidotransferase subunit B